MLEDLNTPRESADGGGAYAPTTRARRKPSGAAAMRPRTATQPQPDQPLEGQRIAILATDGVEQSELQSPKRALESAGARVDVIAPKAGAIRAWHSNDWGDEIDVDLELAAARADDYDALVLPGGTLSADRLRTEPQAVRLVKAFAEARKPIAAICHGPWLLIEADVVDGRRMTAWASLKTDIRNAGGEWLDREVVADRGIVTSRKPDDLPAFNRQVIETLAKRRDKRIRIGPPDAS
ncbi:MAG TPA: type 1 glutamine amidotransferase domain-containing protein [Solimonas sp.]|nr:type 1 glutamine amidotransferase domain-containing protein [Solimonas sp.]